MKCHFCDNEATVHLTEIVNNQMVELHLCETHASEKGADLGQSFSIADLFSGFTDLFSEPNLLKETSRSVCKSCGISFEEFSKKGRLGCEKCYDSFKSSLLPLIKRIQRSGHHQGKSPALSDEAGKMKVRIQKLQSQLQKTIEGEDYEKAAELRDEIRKLEVKPKSKDS